MATFDTLIDDLATQFGLGANARTLVREVLAMISSSPGGFGGFLDKFKSAGLTSEVASWLGRADASPSAPPPSRATPIRARARRVCAEALLAGLVAASCAAEVIGNKKTRKSKP